MASRPTKQAKLDEAAHARIVELQTALASQELPDYIKIEDILSALVLFTTPEQLEGMLRGYWRYT